MKSSGHRCILLFRFLLFLSFASCLYSGEIRILLSGASELGSIRAKDLKSLFLMQVDRVDGIRLEVIEHPFDSFLRQDFARDYLNMNHQQMKDYWLKRFITYGQLEPRVKKNCRAALRYLVLNPQSIAYCEDPVELPEGVRILEVRHH